MRIHLKDPNYLYNKTYYEEYFHGLKLESNSIKNLMKLYSTKTDAKKKLCLKKIKPKKKNDIEINISDDDNKNIEGNKLENEIRQKEKDNNNLFKVESKNFKLNNIKKSKIIINNKHNKFNNNINQSNNSRLTNCKLGELFDNNAVNNNLMNVNNKSIDLLNIINSKSFNISNNLNFSLNNCLNNNNIPFNNNFFFDFNNNLLLNNQLNNNLYNYFNNNLNQMNLNLSNLNILNQNFLNIPTNTIINENNILQAKIDLLNSIGINFGQNLLNINPNLNIELKNQNK